MNNRLQFRHHGVGSGFTTVDGVFDTRSEALEYIYHDIAHHTDGMLEEDHQHAFSVYAEPTVLRYKNEEDEENPHLIMVIGTYTNPTNKTLNNRFCVIDIDKTEKEIADLAEEIEKAVRSLTIVVNDTNTLDLFAEKTDDGTIVSGDVKVPDTHVFEGETLVKDNKILAVEDGLFTYVNLEFDQNNDTFKFTVNDTEKEIQIENNYLVSAEYKPQDESLHITMKNGDEILVNLEELIAEWTVEGENANSPIVLTREEVGYGDTTAHQHVEPWQDILSADVRIANDRVNNILKKTDDNRYLYVDGIASNIAYYKNGEKTTVKDTLDELTSFRLSTDSNNIVTKKPDGYFASAKLEYTITSNTLVFKTSSNEEGEREKVTEIKLNSFQLLDDIYYDSATEELVINYIDGNNEFKTIRVALGEMFEDWEWTVNNYGHNVNLQKVRMVQGSDQLSADVVLSDNADNILKDVNHSLYVKGTADNIKYGNGTVADEITALKNSDASQTEQIASLETEVASKLVTVDNFDHSINVDKTNATAPVVSVNLSSSIEDNKSNIIKLNSDGLYAGVDLEYVFNGSTNQLIFKTTNGTKTFDLKTNSVVDNIYYDPVREAIIIQYTVNGQRMPDVVVPVSGLITEWRVYDGHDGAIQLTKDRKASGASEQDVLRADIVISASHADNIITNDNGGLYVSGQQIVDNANAIAAETARATSAESAIATSVSSEASRARSAEEALEASVVAERERAMGVENAIQTGVTQSINTIAANVATEEYRAKTAELDLEHKIEAVSAANTTNANAIASETNRAQIAESGLDSRITNNVNALSAEVNRAQLAEANLSNAIGDVDTKADTNASAITANTSAITAETNRATTAEATLSSRITTNAENITAEETRARASETALGTAISAEETRAINEERRLEEKIDNKVTPISVEDTTTLDLSIDANNKIKGNVIVANGANNIIKASSDSVVGSGLYASVDITYDSATNSLVLNTSAAQKTIALGNGISFITDAYYDSVTKELVIVYDSEGTERTLRIPVDDLFNDWVVQEGQHLGAIILHKEEGTQGNPDVLSAEVVVSTLQDNMLVNNQGSLYVSSAPIDALDDRIDELDAKIDDQYKTTETHTITLGHDNAEGFYGHVKLSQDARNLLQIDTTYGASGLLFDGNIDCGEY